MALISISDLTVRFDDPPLLDGIRLTIERAERVCLIGRNGTGKSTLLKIIAGEGEADAGEVARERGIVVAYLPQEVPENVSGSVFDVIAQGLANQGRLLAEYHHASAALAVDANAEALARLDEVQHELEAAGAWQMHAQVERVITHMGLDADAECAALSAGMKRRVLMARALVAKPDLLLLDEPTNHLDIDTIAWLEEHLLSTNITLLFVTHDRMFLRKLATRIVEIDRGKTASFACDYDTYLDRKESLLEAETKQRAQFEKKLAQEETWLRQGVKARRTRNEGRVKTLVRMREFKRSLRQRFGSVHLQAQEAQRTGKLVIEMEDARFGYTDTPIVRDFSTTILRGDKVGIIGPNGSGKTTLLRLLLGELPLQSGSLRYGTHLKKAYFDQLRAKLDEERSVADNIADGNPLLTIDGRQRHVIGYLQDFLFAPERARSPVSTLSGGERNRLLLAKLFTLPSNLLVLDEPTNDLDAETLDLLEEMLVNYGGTVLLVSHDRSFLNNVVTSTIVLEGGGRVQEYVGGYDDWLRQRKKETPPEGDKPKTDRAEKELTPSKKLTFKEKRELAELPARIEALETEKQERFKMLSDPQVYSRAGGVSETQARIDAIEAELARAYEQWAELEGRVEG